VDTESEGEKACGLDPVISRKIHKGSNGVANDGGVYGRRSTRVFVNNAGHSVARTPIRSIDPNKRGVDFYNFSSETVLAFVKL